MRSDVWFEASIHLHAVLCFTDRGLVTLEISITAEFQLMCVVVIRRKSW